MGFRFHRVIKLFSGVRLHLSKSGISISFGGPGFSLNVGGKKSSISAGIPGTGVSYRSSKSWFKPKSKPRGKS